MKFNGGTVLLVPPPGADRTNNNPNPPHSLLPTDLEFLLREITDFCSLNPAPTEIPKVLDDYLNYVAKTGNIVFPWPTVKGLFRSKLASSLNQFSGPPGTEDEQQVFNRFDLFRSAPFTIQRLTELINNPTYHYKIKEKYLFALEKTVFVVSTVEPFDVNPVANGSEKNGEDADISSGSGSEELNSTFTVTQEGSPLKDGPDTEMEQQEVSTEMEIAKEDEVPVNVSTVLPPISTPLSVSEEGSEEGKVIDTSTTTPPAAASTDTASQITTSDTTITTDSKEEMTPIPVSATPLHEECVMKEDTVEIATTETVAEGVVGIPESENQGIAKQEGQDPVQAEEEEKMIIDDVQVQPEQEKEQIAMTPSSSVSTSTPCNLFLCKKAIRKWDVDLY